MKNADMPAMPVVDSKGSPFNDLPEEACTLGLTKREFFAAMAMQGLIAGGGIDPGMAAPRALEYADALLVELEDQP